jgi:phospholipid/cholesterol/gamma-HCH transport system permease protein
VGASTDEGAVVQALREIGRIGIFAGALAARLFRRPFFWSEALYHLWTTTLRCLLPVVAVTLPFGMVIALQGLEIFRMFGAERLLSSLVSVAVLRELSPVLASVLVAAQGGSSTAAELGSMRIKEEIDATEVMAVDGLQYLVLPRFLGLMLATPLQLRAMRSKAKFPDPDEQRAFVQLLRSVGSVEYVHPEVVYDQGQRSRCCGPDLTKTALPLE